MAKAGTPNSYPFSSMGEPATALRERLASLLSRLRLFSRCRLSLARFDFATAVPSIRDWVTTFYSPILLACTTNGHEGGEEASDVRNDGA